MGNLCRTFPGSEQQCGGDLGIKSIITLTVREGRREEGKKVRKRADRQSHLPRFLAFISPFSQNNRHGAGGED